jgi:glycosyltransferase involved in cell wall biosynthesis
MYCGAGGLIRRVHRDKAFDVLFAEDASGDVAAGARVAHELGIPCVGMVIGRDLNDCSRRGRAYRNAIARGLEACDAVVCNSEPLATLVGELTGGRQRGVVISRGVDVGLLRPAEPGMRSALRNELGLPGGELVVYAGYLEREKGVYELLEAFLRVRGSHPGASLLLAGTGAERPGLARLVAGAGAKERVSFLGHVDHDRMPRLLQACDIAVMPSWHEGMPNAVVEAIACGLPVIATRVGGIPAAVRHGESGLLVPPRDPVALAAALSDLLKDASKRAQFGHEARLIAEARFDARANAGRLADLLEGTVRAYRRGATTSGRAPRRG